ncbi:hypothetical protein [Thiocystis minor]|uniref:hypothetical protein n=1 Tax=Thiocystis minor TaxID=61597 RepID=UPI001F5CE4FE|nr:hypothetical protein [Thiocystis minor]
MSIDDERKLSGVRMTLLDALAQTAAPDVDFEPPRATGLVRPMARDALIAATALVHGMTVVTRNVPDFAPTGVQILNPRADA